MKKIYDTIDKWTRALISLAGLTTFTIITVIGSYEGHGWPVIVVGFIGILGFGRMLRNTMRKYFNTEGYE